MGAILPESIVSSKSHAYVVQYMQKVADLVAVVGMPEALFKTSGKGGTHTKTVAVVLQKKPSKSKRSSVFFADAKWCGHDSRGRSVPLNHVPQIAANFAEFRESGIGNYGHLGIAVTPDRLGLNLAPRAFEFDAESESDRLEKTHDIVSLEIWLKMACFHYRPEMKSANWPIALVKFHLFALRIFQTGRLRAIRNIASRKKFTSATDPARTFERMTFLW